MQNLVAILLLLFIVAAARASEPTLADARADVDATRYPAALAKISRILAGSASKPAVADRYDLLMLRGECMLHTASAAEAANAYAGAFREVDLDGDPNKADAKKAAQARAMELLTKAAPRLVYRPSKDAAAIDIVEPESRKKAMAALLDQRFASAERRMRAAVGSPSLLPTKALLPTLADLYALEFASTGDAVRTRAAINAFDAHARQVLDAELARIRTRVAGLNDLANQAILSQGPPQQLSYRGLTSPERNELRDVADTLLEIDQVIRDGIRVSSSVGNDTEPWQTLMQQCSDIKATAQKAHERSY